MPIYLPPLNRRRLLRGALAAAAAATLPRSLFAADRNPHSIALLADTHIHSDPTKVHGGVTLTANLKQTVRELLAHASDASSAIVLGDCAFGDGRLGDYMQFAKVIEPLRTAGWPLHLALGNHDDREVFLNAGLSPRAEPASEPMQVAHKLVHVLPGERANWFILDSLMKVNVVTGELGNEQIAWLGNKLDQHRDKPAIIGVHHPPQFDLRPGETPGGIKDTAEFFDCLRARSHVKAVVFGHTHRWGIGERDGIHLINLPPTAYVFEPGRPNGWVEMKLAIDGAVFTLHTLDAKHPANGEEKRLTWRAA